MIGFKFFKWLFLTLSLFIVCACFIRKINNKPPLTMNYVLKRFESANIQFSFANHVKEYQDSLQSVSFDGDASDLINGVLSIASNVFQTCKLIVLFFIDTIKCGIDIMTVVIDILGFELDVSSGTAIA